MITLYWLLSITQWLLPPTSRCPLPATVRLLSPTGVKGLPSTSYCHRNHALTRSQAFHGVSKTGDKGGLGTTLPR